MVRLLRPNSSSVICWRDPVIAFRRNANSILTEIGQDLASRCEQIVTAIKEGN
jgi:hypothetical protein